MVSEENSPPKAEPVVVLHIFPSFGFGGQQARFAALAAGMGTGFIHHVVSLDDDMAARALLPDDAPVEFRKLAARKSSIASISNIFRFRKLFKSLKPDILCTYNWGSIEAVLANRLGGAIPHLHFEDGFGSGESPATQPVRRVAARRLLLSKSTIIVPSRVLEDVARTTWRLPAARVRRIENGVDFARLQAADSMLKSTVSVGTLGALRPEKNYARLIKCFAAADKGAKATLTIIGAGPERDSLKSVVAETGASERISLPGSTDSPHLAYQDFDIFVLSSDTEQAPISLMEAMAAGLPVAATNVGDIAAMVAEENRAFITPLGDDEAYTQALAHLIQNPHARATLGAANRKKARTAFDAARMISEHRNLYLAMVHRDG